ncbi:LPXTG cell wall anchor domain-containing protein, partial [Streptococcus oralis]
TNVPLTYEVAGQFSKKAVVSEKALPNTGSEQSIILLLMGMVAGLAGILSSRKPKQK